MSEETAGTNAPEGGAATDDTEAEQLLATATAEEDTDTDTESKPDPAAELAKWKSLARKHERTAKENSAAAKKLADLEDANKSESQKLNDQLSSAQVELQELRVEKIRAAACREAGLDPELAEYITAADPDDAVEQAKKLAERLKPKLPPPADMRQGVRTQASPAGSVDDWIRSSAGRST